MEAVRHLWENAGGDDGARAALHRLLADRDGPVPALPEEVRAALCRPAHFWQAHRAECLPRFLAALGPGLCAEWSDRMVFWMMAAPRPDLGPFLQTLPAEPALCTALVRMVGHYRQHLGALAMPAYASAGLPADAAAALPRQVTFDQLVFRDFVQDALLCHPCPVSLAVSALCGVDAYMALLGPAPLGELADVLTRTALRAANPCFLVWTMLAAGADILGREVAAGCREGLVGSVAFWAAVDAWVALDARLGEPDGRLAQTLARYGEHAALHLLGVGGALGPGYLDVLGGEMREGPPEAPREFLRTLELQAHATCGLEGGEEHLAPACPRRPWQHVVQAYLPGLLGRWPTLARHALDPGMCLDAGYLRTAQALQTGGWVEGGDVEASRDLLRAYLRGGGLWADLLSRSPGKRAAALVCALGTPTLPPPPRGPTRAAICEALLTEEPEPELTSAAAAFLSAEALPAASLLQVPAEQERAAWDLGRPREMLAFALLCRDHPGHPRVRLVLEENLRGGNPGALADALAALPAALLHEHDGALVRALYAGCPRGALHVVGRRVPEVCRRLPRPLVERAHQTLLHRGDAQAAVDLRSLHPELARDRGHLLAALGGCPSSAFALALETLVPRHLSMGECLAGAAGAGDVACLCRLLQLGRPQGEDLEAASLILGRQNDRAGLRHLSGILGGGAPGVRAADEVHDLDAWAAARRDGALVPPSVCVPNDVTEYRDLEDLPGAGPPPMP